MQAPPSIHVLTETLTADQRISAAILFGSAARDQLRPDSDIDVAILLRGPMAQRELTADPFDTLGALGLAAGCDVHLVFLTDAEFALRRSVSNPSTPSTCAC